MKALPIFLFIAIVLGCTNSGLTQDTLIHPPTTIPNTTQPAIIPDSIKSVVIADTRVSGYKKTKLYIIEREIPFKKGDAIPAEELQKRLELCRQQLMNTSLFVDVEVKVARRSKELVFIDVNIKERWYLFPLPYFKIVDRNFNVWWNEHKRSLDWINYGLKFMHNNVSGRNDKLNIWLINGYTQQASIRYQNPFLDKSLKHGMNVGFAYARNREMNVRTDLNKPIPYETEDKDFLRRQIHFDLAYSYRPAIKTRHNFRIAFTNEVIHDSVFKENPKYFGNNATQVTYLDFSYNIQHFNVDYIPYPLKGFMGDAYFNKRGLSSKTNMWQVGGKGTYTMPVFPTSFLQFQGAGMLKLPFDQPYFNQGMFGGSDFYMRGLEYYIIDGVAGGFGRATAIQKALDFKVRNVLNVKGHDKIPFRVFVKAFGDAGYAYSKNPGNSMLNNKLLHSYGVGLDVITFYDIVMKFEYSYNPYEPVKDRKWGFFLHTKSDF